jgi:basic membrane protein A
VLLAAMLLAACNQPVTQDPDCSKADVFCVGLVTDAGKINDGSFNQSTWEGVRQAQEGLGATVAYIETTDAADYGANIARFGDAKYDMVVTVGYALAEATQVAGKAYPDIKFIGVDQLQTPGTQVANVVGLIFAEDKAGFLAGALAAQMSKSGKIGAVLGTDTAPAVWRFGEGYRAGAQYVRPDVEVSVVYHNDVTFDQAFADPQWGRATAISMIDRGIDVVFGAGGETGNGALQGCAERGVMAIGVDADQYYTVPAARDVLLTSAMKLLTPGVYELVKRTYEGHFPETGNFIGEVGLGPYHELESRVPVEVNAKIAEISQALQNGALLTNVSLAKPE